MAHSSKGLVNSIIKYRILIIIAVILITALSGYYISKIKVDNDNMKSVPQDLKELVDWKTLQDIFPSPFTLIFMSTFEEGSLQEKTDSLASWAKQFESVIVDNETGVTGTVHIGTLKVPVKGGFFGIKPDYIIPKKKKLSEEKLRERIKRDSTFTKALISGDEKILSMVLNLNPNLSRPKIAQEVVTIVDQINTYPGINAYITGASATVFFVDREMKKDFSRLLPLVILVAAILLYLIFKKILYVFASLFIIAIALVWTFGILGFSGIGFSVVISVIPVILFPIGVANSIHVLKTYSRHHWIDRKNFTESFIETYDELIRPIILTSVTTFIGFGSFVFSQIAWTRHFGVFTGIGVMLSLFLTVILLPIFVHYEPKKNKNTIKDINDVTLSDNFITKYRKLIFESYFTRILLLIVLLLTGIGVFLVKYESNPISMFSKNSSIRKSDDLIAQEFGGTKFFYILLSTQKGGLKETEQWKQVQTIINHIKKDTAVGSVESIMPLINKTSSMLSNKPISKAGLSILLKSKGLFGKSLKKIVSAWVTPDKKTTKLWIICRNIPKFQYTDLANRFESHINEKHPGFDVHIAGPALLIDSMLFLIINTLISSMSAAFISVFIVLVLLYRSFKTGFNTTIPMILSTVFVYALMGLLRIPINTVTVIVMNTCIGIGIDYSIHFTSGFLYIRHKYNNNIDALMATVKNKGTVIMFNTLVVGTGFFVLLFSSFPPIRLFGFIIFVSMLVSSLFSLIFLPIRFKNFKYESKLQS